MKRRFILRIVAVVLGIILGGSSTAQVNILTYHNNNSRTGLNPQETILTPENVQAKTFGKLFVYPVDGYVYAQPLFVSGLNIPNQGTHNVVFVATQHNSVYAFDADNNGSGGGLLWQINLGPAAPTPSTAFGNNFGAFDDIVPEVGITSTPVIDPNTGTLYVDAFTQEGQSFFHRIHALDIATGTERSYSPVIVSASIKGTGTGSTNGVLRFQAKQQIQRAALTLASGILYVCFGSYADTDPFHGWIIGYNPGNLQQLPAYVFNSTPNSSASSFRDNAGGGGIWMAGGGLAVDSNNYLYLATGDGAFNANTNGTEFANSFLKLSTGGKLSVADYFTPWNQSYLASHNLDLGSGGIMLLPDQPGRFPHLMIGAGKSGLVYLMNRDMLTAGNNHFNTNGATDAVVQTVSLQGGAFDTPAYFNGTIYYVGANDALTALSLSNGLLPTLPTGLGPRKFGFPGATPSISANDQADGIVWAIQRASPAVLAAYNATNVSIELYNSSRAGSRDILANGVKFAVPTVANGKVFVGGQYALSVFGLLPKKSDSTFFSSSYNGLFYEAAGVKIETSGAITARTTKHGRYSGTLQTAGAKYPFSGQFDQLGSSSKTINRKGRSPLNLTLQADIESNSGLTGTVGDGTWSADITAYPALFNAKTNPAGAAGKYTLLIPGLSSANAQTPQGNGFAALNVAPAGRVTFGGMLPDGTKITETGFLSQNGQWPFYTPLYHGQGQLLGWLNFITAPSRDVAGQLSWIKLPIDRAVLYPQGFEFDPMTRGSAYVQPGKNSPALNFTDGQLILSGAGLAQNLVNDLTLNSNNKITNLSSNKLTLTLSPSTGLFKGTVVSPDDGKSINFRGAILQDENSGSGYFLRDNQSGKIFFGPR
jgi:hypothetical protein